jgi:YggT family protein
VSEAPTFLLWFDAFVRILRVSLFVAVVILAVICLVDWLVRTRRINPFNPIARRMRSTVDPLMAPVERRIVAAGGLPTSAPWWTLVFVVIGTLILITLLGFIRSQMIFLSMSSRAGVGGIAMMLISWTFDILLLALIVRVISSWFRMSPWSPWIRWSYQLTEWFMAPLRRVVPTIGVIDITPIVAYFLLRLIEAAFFSVIGGG